MKRGEVIRGSKTALITGAARGLGREYAFRLAELGYNLILVGRSVNIESVKLSLLERYDDISVQTFIIDLSTPDSALQLYNCVTERCLEVDVLVNNAGIFSFRDIELTDSKVIEQMIYLHDMTLVKLNRLFATDMARRGGGYILNMSSFSIWMPLPGIALYSATKSFVKSFSVAFSKEVRQQNIYVTAVCPAGIATDLYGLSPRFQTLGVKVGALMTPKKCARLSLNLLWRHKRCGVPDWWSIPLIPLMKHLPGFAENLIRRKTMKFQK